MPSGKPGVSVPNAAGKRGKGLFKRNLVFGDQG
jgi:hypothetical protein